MREDCSDNKLRSASTVYEDCPKTFFTDYAAQRQFVMDADANIVIGGPGIWLVMEPDQALLAGEKLVELARQKLAKAEVASPS